VTLVEVNAYVTSDSAACLSHPTR